MEYEIHITVQTGNFDQFRSDCEEIKVKPIIIQTSKDKNIPISTQVMSSSKHSGSNMLYQMEVIALFFQGKGYKIMRKKIEIYPANKKHGFHLYYESHIRLNLPKNYERTNLNIACKKYDFHVSRNLLKADADTDYLMITFRAHDTEFLNFEVHVGYMKLALIGLGIKFDKVEIEECVFDSNISIDNEWLNIKA